MAKSYTFRAFDREGDVIAQSRGRAGAFDKVIAALHSYRDAVEQGSGYLYGYPQSLGGYSVDGIDMAFGPTAHLMDADYEIGRLDRLGLTRVARISDEVYADPDDEIGDAVYADPDA